jgi:hypothetical protein
MAFDQEKMRQPITRLEIADLSLSIMGALQATRWALESIASKRDAGKDIASLAKEIDAFVEKWEQVTGWKSENDR